MKEEEEKKGREEGKEGKKKLLAIKRKKKKYGGEILIKERKARKEIKERETEPEERRIIGKSQRGKGRLRAHRKRGETK